MGDGVIGNLCLSHSLQWEEGGRMAGMKGVNSISIYYLKLRAPQLHTLPLRTRNQYNFFAFYLSLTRMLQYIPCAERECYLFLS